MVRSDVLLTRSPLATRVAPFDDYALTNFVADAYFSQILHKNWNTIKFPDYNVANVLDGTDQTHLS